MSDTAYAPWMDDADPPDDLTDAELEKMLNGVAQLLKESEQRNWDESEHPRDEAGKFTDAGGGDEGGIDAYTNEGEASSDVASIISQIGQDKGDIAEAINKLPEVDIRGSSFNENGEAARKEGEDFAAHIENGFMRIATEHPSLILNARVAGIGVYRVPEDYDNGYPGLGTVACFDRGNWRISVFQRAFDNFGTDVTDTRQGRQREVLMHEVCHAYDFQKTISVTDTFKKAMSDDFNELHNLQKEMDAVKKLTGMYGIISRVTRSERELFAEVGSRILWPKAAARDEFFKLFPRTTQVIINSFKKDGLI